MYAIELHAIKIMNTLHLHLKTLRNSASNRSSEYSFDNYAMYIHKILVCFFIATPSAHIFFLYVHNRNYRIQYKIHSFHKF